MPMSALVLLVCSLWFFARSAEASEGRDALGRASEALRMQPPRRDEARAMLERAAASTGDDEAVAEADARLGEMDEDDGSFAQAMAHDRASVAAAPDSGSAVRASNRIDWLLDRSEGGFAPLRRLERVRRNSALASDPAAIDELARDARAFPPGRVRVEARMLVAEAWLRRLRRPSDAVAELRNVTDDPHADPLTAGLAERELVQALVDEGKIDQAGAEARAHANLLDARFVRSVNRLGWRQFGRRAAIAIIVAFAGLSFTALVRAGRRGALGGAARALRTLAPIAVAFVAFFAFAGGALASNYESGSATPFLLLGAATLPVVLLGRAWSAVGAPRRSGRVARAALCGATVLAAAFALLDVVSPQYLEGFGL